MKKVIAYVRVSTEEQRLGTEAQRQAIAAWCKSKGYELLKVHEDLGISGGAPLDKRPALTSAIGDLRAYKADILLVAKRDRLARDVMVAAMVERLAEREGAMVLSADGVGNGSGPAAEFMRNMMAAFAQYERALICSRTKSALAVKKARGEAYCRVPFGFMKQGNQFVADPEQAKSEQAALHLYMLNGSYNATAKALNDSNARTPRGGRWHASSVRNLIKRVQAKIAAA